MTDRRNFLKLGTWGLCASGVVGAAGSTGLMLSASAEPTPASGELGEHSPPIAAIPKATPPKSMSATEDNILGPYFVKGAPFRGKITPPLEPGEPLVIRGRVWAADSRRPLPGAVLDIWQANAEGRYDNDDAENPPKPGVFCNRARLVVDETGFYEFETIRPGRYSIGPNQWRPSHIHYMVQCSGYKTLVTQLYFAGDPMNDKDAFIKPSLIISPEKVKHRSGVFELGTFDIVLPPAKA